VQAYRYENFKISGLKKFFFSRVFQNLEIANSFHWLVHLEQYDPPVDQKEFWPEEEENEDANFIKEKYQDLYDEFLDICEKNYPEYFQSIEVQRQFRENTVEVVYKVRRCPGKNDI
jgi:hypothetical protein